MGLGGQKRAASAYTNPAVWNEDTGKSEVTSPVSGKIKQLAILGIKACARVQQQTSVQWNSTSFVTICCTMVS